MNDVALDGSPVEVYVALPGEPDLARVRSILSPGACVLDLGSGPGRISNPLVVDGHRVVAVDDSPEMLDRVVGAETVLGDIRALELGRRFDAVLALSHLINHPERQRRLELLGVCRRHLAEDGVVLVQRYPPAWLPVEGVSEIGCVTVRLHDVVHHGESFAAAVTYTVGAASWIQRFTAAIVDDTEFASLAAASDLAPVATLDSDGAWVLMAAARRPQP